MSTLKIGALKNNGSAVALPNGVKVGGNEIIQGYTSSGTEPTSPAKGDFWWDSTNELLYQYANSEFKEIGITVPVITWTVALSSVTYDSVSLSVGSQDPVSRVARFSVDGTKMLLLGGNNKYVYQYSLSTSFDMSTASYDSVSFSVGSQSDTPMGMSLNKDGTKVYVCDFGGILHQYSLSTAYDVSTMSYDSVSFNFQSLTTVSSGVEFNADGTKLYLMGYGNSTLYQHTLSTAFDISTATYDSVSLNQTSQSTNIASMVFNPEGTKLYSVTNFSDTVYQYTLSTGFDISTATYDSVSKSLTTQDTQAWSIGFNTDGTKMYMVGFTGDKVYQYSTGL